MLKPIAAISMARNDNFFVDKWISYYGIQLGYENIYLFIDGMDQKLPKEASKINCYKIPHKDLKRADGDRLRAKKISNFALDLYPKYRAVLAMDIDEFLVLDPKIKQSLKTYLNKEFNTSSLSALGLDVGQHPKLEKAIDFKKPFLSQRAFAQVSDRYTKPVVSFKPIRWGSGFHRIKWKNYTIDSNLFLFHFGLVDRETFKRKINEGELVNFGWDRHFLRRLKLYKAIEFQSPEEGDLFFEKARKYFGKNRKLFAWNKPATLKYPGVVKIPERFKFIV